MAKRVDAGGWRGGGVGREEDKASTKTVDKVARRDKSSPF